MAHRELLATVSCSAGCAIGAFADIKIGRAKAFTVESKLFRRHVPGRTRIPLKFSRGELSKLESGLAQHKQIVATMYAALIDSLGEIQQNTAAKRLRITS